MSRQLVALCIGHSRIVHGDAERGAVACDGKTSEWAFWNALAPRIVAILGDVRIPARIVNRYEGNNYGTAQRWLAGHLKAMDCTLACELHFNDSDNPKANGHEWLYWHSSAAGLRLAESLSREMALQFPDMTPRGAKPLVAADRGAIFVRGTHCPAVLCEPFFGSHAGDFATVSAHLEKLARAIANGITEYLD